jgi:ribA/ribD-fused uncharacterized protein
MTPITTFDGEYRFLSNFYPAKLTYAGFEWADSETAYQAMKSQDPAIHAEMAQFRHPGKAKRFGKQIVMRGDWDFIKVEIMTEIVTAKFDQNPILKQRLIDTGFARIEEGNTWNDTTWGICPPNSGIGKNYLGVILMKLRQRYIDALPHTFGNVYAGIGSRETPEDVLEQMKDFAEMAAKNGWMLRSGGAVGADSAFEEGAVRGNGARQIFLPWPQLNDRYSTFVQPSPHAYEIAADVHVRWKFLPPRSQALIARNMHQVVGLTHQFPPERSKCVICWTPDGCETPEEYGAKTGGTGSAIFLAGALDIPVFNLKRPGRLEAAIDFMFSA